jgi:hypothetical protein
MMELGELDDPSETLERPIASPRLRAANTFPKSPPIARGLGLPLDRDKLFDDHEQVGITDPVQIEQRRNAVTAPVRPRVETPVPPPPLARGGGALPIPRAPSVHPDEDATEPGGRWFEGADAPVAEEPAGPPPRMTPQPRPAGGLRLGKGRAAPVRAATPAAPAASVASSLVELEVSEPAPMSAVDRVREMLSLFDANNYSSALVLAESVLVSDPGNEAARRCAESCRESLGQKYLGRLGGRTGIPRVIMPPEEMRWLSLDHRAGFLLSSIDGSMSVDEVLDVCSMPELDALRIMFDLREQGVIEIAEPYRRPRR